MRSVLPILLIALAVLSLSRPVWAQDEGDHYEEMIKSVQDRKARSVEQVMTAPAIVQDRMRHTDFDIGMDEDPNKKRKTDPVVSPFDTGEDDDTWTIVIAISIALLGFGFFFVTRRYALR